LAVVVASVSLRSGVGEVFSLFTRPEGLELLHPPEMRVRVLKPPREFKEGEELAIAYTMLGQRFRIRFKIAELRENSVLTLEAVGSPFRVWRHEHRFSERDGEAVLVDRVELKTIQGPLADYVAAIMIRRVLEYRNTALKRMLEGSPQQAVYRDPLRISLAAGTVLTLLGSAAGFILLTLLPTGGFVPDLLLGFASLLLLWFFPHDLAHLVVGYLAGVRFSHYYVGLSNLSRLLPTKVKTLPLALGLKIDHAGSRAGARGFAAMYLAGPLASMLLPFIPPAVVYTQAGLGPVAAALLSFASANLVFSLFFSYRVGCIGKALRVLRRGRG